MDDVKNTILFTIVYQGMEYQVQTNRTQYHSLMTLISDQLNIPGFGLCSGMGSCGTCMVEIQEKNINRKRFELACDIQINDDLANTKIIVTTPRY